jgi:hypothetical protein
VDLETAIVVNEYQFLKFVHEEIDTRARRTNHLSAHLLVSTSGRETVCFLPFVISDAACDCSGNVLNRHLLRA